MEAKNTIVWFEIYVDDMERAQKFYEKILDIQLSDMTMPNTLDDMKMLVFPSDANGLGVTGALVKMEGFNAGSNSTIVYFGSEDCAIEESRIEEAGGKVHQSKQSLGDHGFMMLAYDSEGNIFGVHSIK